MKSIIDINYVSDKAPNIVLVGAVDNSTQDGYYLKHFKNTHNIFKIVHQLDDNFDLSSRRDFEKNDFSWYYNLHDKYDIIKKMLDEKNLSSFIICSLSFGSLLIYWLIFHMPERVEKAFIHDYYIKSSS